MKTFGAIVKENRKAKGLTIEQLAKPCGTHKGYISGIENGVVRAPSPKVISKLCKKLGLDATEMTALAYWEKRPKAVSHVAMYKLLCQLAGETQLEKRPDPAPAATDPLTHVPAPATEAAAS